MKYSGEEENKKDMFSDQKSFEKFIKFLITEPSEEIDLKNYFDDRNVNILRELNINIEDKLYDLEKFKILKKEIKKIMDFKDAQAIKKIINSNISFDEYIRILEIIIEISIDYGIYTSRV